MMAKEGKDFSVMFAPYLFKSQEHYRRFIKSDHFKNMMADAEEKIGIKFLGLLGDRAPRALASVVSPITSPDDMKGLKIRLPQLPFVAEVWKEWGANPTQIKGGDLYQALQSGMVDGDDNGIDVLLERGLNEVGGSDLFEKGREYRGNPLTAAN